MIKTIYASDLKSRAILVMNYLVFRSNNVGTCFPTIKTIAKECHIGVNTVKRALDDLVDVGFIKKEVRFLEAKNGAQTSNLYTISAEKIKTGIVDSTDIVESTEVVAPTVQETVNQQELAVMDQDDSAIPVETFEEITADISNGTGADDRVRICPSLTSDSTSEVGVQPVNVYAVMWQRLNPPKNPAGNGHTHMAWAAPQPTGVPP